MKIRLGIWHDEVSVFFREDPRRGFRVELDGQHRLLVLLPGDFSARLNSVGAEDIMDFPWRLDDRNCSRNGFSRCCLMEVDLQPDGNALVGPLLDNHDMPWPRARDCNTYLRAEELMLECLVRKNSAKAAGKPMPTPPAHVQVLMTPEMRVALFA